MTFAGDDNYWCFFLAEAAQFIRNLKNDRVKLNSEMESLKKEIQLLQDDLKSVTLLSI